MRDNPLHERVFGASGARMERLLAPAFERVLAGRMATGHVYAAYGNSNVLGVVAMAAPGACRLSLRDQLAMAGVVVRSRAVHRLPHVLRWLWVWARHDPRSVHWHLGPAAVAREQQGRGIGSRLMPVVCDTLDRDNAVGYLETDKQANVRLYRRGGFEVVAQRPVLGVTNWFMMRQPRP